jgi:hypothetical protein
MKGLLYRLGERIKELGERLGRFPVLCIFHAPLIKLGLAVKNSV